MFKGSIRYFSQIDYDIIVHAWKEYGGTTKEKYEVPVMEVEEIGDVVLTSECTMIDGGDTGIGFGGCDENCGATSGPRWVTDHYYAVCAPAYTASFFWSFGYERVSVK